MIKLSDVFKQTVDIDNLKEYVIYKDMEFSEKGLNMTGIMINPITYRDIVSDVDYRMYTYKPIPKIMGMELHINSKLQYTEMRFIVE